jgi:DNA-binding MarR family transcriptional regulator
MASASLDRVIQVAEFRTALRRFLRQNERVAAQHGLTPQRYLLLLMIKGAPGGSQRSTVMELTERLQLAQHTVTELVGRAERTGLIRREWSTSDRRVAYLRLTAKGEHKFAASFRDLDADRQSLSTLVAAIGSLGPLAKRSRS